MNKSERANLKRLFKKVNDKSLCETLIVTEKEDNIILQGIDTPWVQAYNIKIPNDLLPITASSEHENDKYDHIRVEDIIDYLNDKCDHIPTTKIYYPVAPKILEILETDYTDQPNITLIKDEIRSFRTVMKALKLLDDYSNSFKIINEKETVFLKMDNDLFQSISLSLTLNMCYLGENSLKGKYSVERVSNLLDIYQNCEHLELYMGPDCPLYTIGSIPGLFSFESMLASVIYDYEQEEVKK